ncbi:MAG: flippase-like domain-containing protein [Ignavibacteriae bacterium]|nr:flippase-like domain-containing protein [Ignavibacteriota bacterium]
MRKHFKNIILVLSISLFVYIILAIYSDVDLVYKEFINFPISKIITALLIAIGILIFKFFRWNYLLKLKSIKIDLISSVQIFCTGLIMSVSPGKFGELIKSYFLKDKFNIEYSLSVPVIIAERFSEFFTLLILESLILILIFKNFSMILLILIAAIIVLILAANRTFFSKIVLLFSQIKFLKIDKSKSDAIIDSRKLLFNPTVIAYSFFSWLLEFFCFYIILSNFITDIFVLEAVSSYAIAIIFGSITMLPGGIGTTESSLAYLLVNNGLNLNYSVVTTIFIRILTLWIPVLIGFASLTIYWKKNKIHL